MNRRLYRCRDNRRIAGVAAGVAEFFDLDPTLVRVLWFVSIFFYGLGLLLYIGLAIIVPLEPISAVATTEATTDDATVTVAEPEGHRHPVRGGGPWTMIVGLTLVLFGVLALLDRVLPNLDVGHFIVPAGALGIGVYLIVSALRRESMEA